MAKKSKKKKKHQKKYHFVQTSAATSAPATPSQPAAVEQAPSGKSEQTAKAPIRPKTSQPEPSDEFALKTKLLAQEARLTAVIGGGIIAALLVLWVVFEHSSIGPSIYRLIKL